MLLSIRCICKSDNASQEHTDSPLRYRQEPTRSLSSNGEEPPPHGAEHGGHATPHLFEILDLSLNAIDEASDVKGSLRATFIALASLTQDSGIADVSSATPGSRALAGLLDTIERFCERRLMTRSSLGPIIKRAAGE